MFYLLSTLVIGLAISYMALDDYKKKNGKNH